MRIVNLFPPIRSINLACATAVLMAMAASSFGADYNIDEAHSFVQFRAKHIGISWVVGRFNEFSGSFTYDPSSGPSAQSASVQINVKSLDTNHAERDRHILADGFLNADDHPEASFESTSFSGDASGGTLEGDFTLHGVTKPIQIAVKPIGEGNDPWGGYRAGFEGHATIDAREFGVSHHGVSTVELDLFVEGIRK